MVYFEQLLRERVENGGNTASHGSLKGTHQHKPTQMIVHKHGESVIDHY